MKVAFFGGLSALRARAGRVPHAVTFALFSLQFVALDLVARSLHPHTPRAVVASIASAGIGALVWTTATRTWVRALAAVVFGLVLALQILALHHYRTPLDVNFIEAARAPWADVWPNVKVLLPFLLGAIVLAFVVELALLSIRPKKPAPRRAVGALVAISALGLAFGPPLDSATPEVRLLAGLRRLVQAEPPAPRGDVRVEPLASTKSRLPSVLFVLTESVRAKDYCSSPSESCETAPEVNALLPNRIGLMEMRSTSSYTAISVAALSSSRAQLGTREELALAPNVFDFLRAVDGPSRPQVAYLGAQVKHSVWDRANIADGIPTFVTWEDVHEDPGSTDFATTSRFEHFAVEHRGPLFAMLHLYDTHCPYDVVDDRAPFQPASQVASWETLTELHNQYKNAILTQDHELARALSAFIESRDGPWVIVFTSDHGEAFGEHHAIHHGQNLYDEQIHVPGFVAFGNGALSPEEEKVLRERAAGPTSHMDVLPTILDLFGVWDVEAMTPYRREMLGTSLLDDKPSEGRAIPITSCSAAWSCPIRSWGMLGDRHALIGQAWDADFRCVPLDDVGEPVDETPECQRLREASSRYFERKPNGELN